MDISCDVAIIGGAFSGASTALLLKRKHPGLKILIIEKSVEFDRKVGESTTEVSSCFLTKVLGLSGYLGHHHLAKQGLRMWFCDSAARSFDECVEIGALYNSRLSGFQVDRSLLDSHLLDLAAGSGCELLRPARLTGCNLRGVGKNTLEVSTKEGARTVSAKWVVDASGRAAFLARSRQIYHPLTAHPTNAIWGRFSGVKDWDGVELQKRFPSYGKSCRTSRAWATNHLMGFGWWCWIIPLRGGDFSLGLVYDSRLFTPPKGDSLAGRLQEHFLSHPVGREMLADARLVGNDVRAYSSMPYYSEEVIGDGWCIVGDAAGFLDPLYSPGLDFCAFTAQGIQGLVSRSLMGEDISEASEAYNEQFLFCYHSWFEAIYRDKYFYLGDAELMSAAFLLDISAYILGPVWQVFRDPDTGFAQFPFQGVPGRIAATLMKFYNGRLSALARRKRERGCYGDRNAHWRLLVGGFVPDSSVLRTLFRGLGRWLRAELRNLLPLPAAVSVTPHRPAIAETQAPEREHAGV